MPTILERVETLEKGMTQLIAFRKVLENLIDKNLKDSKQTDLLTETERRKAKRRSRTL